MDFLARFFLLVCLLAGPLLPATALAQNYPTKPVRVIVTFPPGSVLEAPIRAISQRLNEVLGQPFVIENRPGAEGIIGADAFARAAPDGYTLCLTDSLNISFNPVIRSKLPYDPRDFAPVIHVGSLASAVVVNPSVPAKSMSELLELARSKPGVLTWGTFGITSPAHILVVWLKKARGIDFLDVPYKSAMQSSQAAMTGEVQVATFGAGTVLPQVKAGKLKALAVNGDARTALMPDVPSFKELGIDVVPRAWFGIFAPGGTPRPVVQRLNSLIAQALADAQFAEKYVKSQGLELVPPAGATPDQFAAFIRNERETFEKVVELTGIRE
jgi:tripartite-type tricarboxylate transporter receptor subunit TctC